MGFFATVETFETLWVDGAGGTAGRVADLASLGTVKKLDTPGKVADLARHGTLDGMLGASTTGDGGTTIDLRAFLMPA